MKQLIISVVLLLIALTATAQISGKSIPELQRELTTRPTLSTFQPINLSTFYSHKINPSFYQKNSIPKYYSYNELAFFCKVEVKLEKAVNFPIKFRLGDVDYVDRLEGKRE